MPGAQAWGFPERECFNVLTPDEQSVFDTAVQTLLVKYEQEDGPKRREDDGERRYVEITSITAPAGCEPEVLHMTLTQAIEGWSRNIMAYLDGKSKITWRIRPEADGQPNVFFLDVMNPDFSFKPFKPIYRPRTQYRVYSRLVAV